MAEKTWLEQIADDDSFWYQNIDTKYPALFQIMYNEIKELASNNNTYGFAIRMKDFFEAFIRFYVLIGIAYADSTEDKETVALLFDPDRSLSFGDWVSALAPTVAERLSSSVPSLSNLLRGSVAIYDKEKVVRWRNDNLFGHGAMREERSESFHDELREKLNALKLCLEKAETFSPSIICNTTKENIVKCTVNETYTFSIAPYIQSSDGGFELFDSLYGENNYAYKTLNYQTGERKTYFNSYFFDIRERFFGKAPIISEESFGEEFYDEKIDIALNSFHCPQNYWKQRHYQNRLSECLKNHTKGVFLLQSESGTGKSTFANYIDGLGKQSLKKQGIICRSYYFSRYSFSSHKDIAGIITGTFCNVAEHETRFRPGNQMPTLNLNTDSSHDLSVFLNSFLRIYRQKFGSEKILLVLDGIDELDISDIALLNCVPNTDDLNDGVYVLITCRSDNIQGSYQEQFINGFPFTEKMFFQPEENRDILKSAIRESVRICGDPLNETQIETLCDILNNRFTGLPIVRALLSNSSDFNLATKADSLSASYLSYLNRLYGNSLFSKLLRILMTIALANEPLSIRQIAQLAYHDLPSVDLLAMMKDITPLMIALRGIEGTKYVIGHPEFGEQLRKSYGDTCKALVSEWIHYLTDDEPKPKVLWLVSYIAGGVSLWNKEILQRDKIEPATLKKMGDLRHAFYQHADTPLSRIRYIRILEGIRLGYLSLWEEDPQITYLLEALDTIGASIRNYDCLEDTQACRSMLDESDRIIALLPDDFEDQKSVMVMFSLHSNLSLICEKLGDHTAANHHIIAADTLLEKYPDQIADGMKHPYLYNRAVKMLQINPQGTLAICDRLIDSSNLPSFLTVQVLTLKSDAYTLLGKPEERAKSIRKALEIAEKTPPANVDDAMVYPNTLTFDGRQKMIIGDNLGALEAFSKALGIYENMYKKGFLPDRFEAARILSHMGEIYYKMDAENGSKIYAEQCLGYVNQSVEIFRFALANHIAFRPAIAEPEFINGAYAYSYYKGIDEALALLDELAAMQNQDTKDGKRILEKCASVKQELTQILFVFFAQSDTQPSEENDAT